MLVELLGAVVICAISILVSFLLGEYLQDRSERRRYQREREKERERAVEILASLEDEPDRIYGYGDFALALAEELSARDVIDREQIPMAAMLTVEHILATKGEIIDLKTREKLNILLNT